MKISSILFFASLVTAFRKNEPLPAAGLHHQQSKPSLLMQVNESHPPVLPDLKRSLSMVAEYQASQASYQAGQSDTSGGKPGVSIGDWSLLANASWRREFLPLHDNGTAMIEMGRGSFFGSCDLSWWSPKLVSAGWLAGFCNSGCHGVYMPTMIDLNKVFQNRNGQLARGGGFLDSCRQTTYGAISTVLGAECLTPYGTWQWSYVTLDHVLGNYCGLLATSTPSHWGCCLVNAGRAVEVGVSATVILYNNIACPICKSGVGWLLPRLFAALQGWSAQMALCTEFTAAVALNCATLGPSLAPLCLAAMQGSCMSMIYTMITMGLHLVELGGLQLRADVCAHVSMCPA